MATLKAGTFTYWNLTEEEELNGRILTVQQKQVLQNELARYSEARLNLKFDPSNVIGFAQEEAELQGQIGVIRWLLDSSDQAESALRAAQSQSLS